ncbi:MAG: ISL3 family transposase, partial [Verrucomicrobiae bacterium]|nr:ISL3 family transposase [Verrucomicrobiae bacterium]
MQDIQLYQQILGLGEPWRVKAVRLNRQAGEVEIEVECTESVWGCPECGERMHVHEWERRRWRHLDSCQYRTILTAEVPRVKCGTHGTQMVKVPWAEKHGRFTALFERLAVDVMLECSVAAACEILRISWDEADGIKQRAVKRGLARRPVRVMKRLCVDEKSIGVGQQYMTIVAEVEAGKSARVEYVGEGRSRESLDAFWEQLSQEQRAGVEAVAMDMWDPFLRSTLTWVPGAAEKIVHDQFHLVQYMNEAVNEVRKAEHRRLFAQGDQSLTGTRQLWLYGMENVPAKWAQRFAEVKGTSLQTARAWAIKEVFRSFWLSADEGEARYRFDEWYGWAIRSRLGAVKKVARMCKRHLQNILTFFKHRLTNGPLEGLNNRIQGLIKKAYGYRNKERFKTDVMFHLGASPLTEIDPGLLTESEPPGGRSVMGDF